MTAVVSATTILWSCYNIIPISYSFVIVDNVSTVKLSSSPSPSTASTRIPFNDHKFNINSHRLYQRPTLSLSAYRDDEDDYDQRSPPVLRSYLATCVPGLAHVLQKELECFCVENQNNSKFVITDIEQSGNAAVTFRASREASLYSLCWLRSAHRLLELVASTSDNYDDYNVIDTIRTRQDIHTFIQSALNIKELLGDGHGGLLTLSVKTIMNNPRLLPKDLCHSHYTALEIKNAICDIVRELRDDRDRPTVDIDHPDVPLVAIFRGGGVGGGGGDTTNNRRRRGKNYIDNRSAVPGASLSLYRSLHPPGSLHKRGYRTGSAIHKAAMKESLAAGLLIEAGWQDYVDMLTKQPDSTSSKLVMVDPMAGSGSLITEACMMATDIAPGLMRLRCGLDSHRMPPVTKWKKSNDEEEADNATLWKKILLDATKRAKIGIQRIRDYQQEDPSRIHIVANDIHPGAVDIMEEALSNAGLIDFVELSNMDCYDLDVNSYNNQDSSDTTTYFIATNPPWGVRLTEDIEDSWDGLRHFIRNKCPDGTQVFILSGDKAATATLKLKRDRMIPLQTGDQNLRWIQYTIRERKGRDDDDNSTTQLDSKPSLTSPKTATAAATTTVANAQQGAKQNEWI